MLIAANHPHEVRARSNLPVNTDMPLHVQVWNLVPRATSGLLCAQVVSTTEHNVALGTEFIQGETYTVLVNGVTETFVAQ